MLYVVVVPAPRPLAFFLPPSIALSSHLYFSYEYPPYTLIVAVLLPYTYYWLPSITLFS